MSVNIVVPIYKSALSGDDKTSLDRLVLALGEYPITVVHPEGLELGQVQSRYPSFKYESFDPKFFKDRMAYNHLMLDPAFYERFLEWDYILIHQCDAFVFRNELQQWCDKGYDYIGAPWLYTEWHRSYIYLELSALKSYYLRKTKGIVDRNIARGKVGSGGFSLRRTRALYDFLVKYPDLAQSYKDMSEYLRYQDDVFWAVEPKAQGVYFKIPKSIEAVNFSFDDNPSLAYQVTNYNLPFGCHGFNKRQYRSFWKSMIAEAVAQGVPSLEVADPVAEESGEVAEPSDDNE